MAAGFIPGHQFRLLIRFVVKKQSERKGSDNPGWAVSPECEKHFLMHAPLSVSSARKKGQPFNPCEARLAFLNLRGIVLAQIEPCALMGLAAQSPSGAVGAAGRASVKASCAPTRQTATKKIANDSPD